MILSKLGQNNFWNRRRNFQSLKRKFLYLQWETGEGNFCSSGMDRCRESPFNFDSGNHQRQDTYWETEGYVEPGKNT